MNKITNKQLFDLYVDTANRCSSDVKLLTDEEIEYNIFKEFDVGVMSFFHDDNLNKIIDEGVIKKEAFQISKEIRNRWIELDKNNWTINEIKSHPVWNSLFFSCDRLIALLNRHE